MSIHISSRVWAATFTSSAEKLVALALADMANDEGLAWPSLRSLSARCGMEESVIRKHIRALESAGVLKREERFKNGRQTSNAYQFTESGWASVPRQIEDRQSCLPSHVCKGEGGIGATPSICIEPSKEPSKVNGSKKENPEQDAKTESDTRIGISISGKKNKARGTEAELIEFCKSLGLTESCGTDLFLRWEGNGWLVGKNQIKDWKAVIRLWKRKGWVGSNNGNPEPPKPPAQDPPGWREWLAARGDDYVPHAKAMPHYREAFSKIAA